MRRKHHGNELRLGEEAACVPCCARARTAKPMAMAVSCWTSSRSDRRSPGAALRIAEQGAATYRREHLAEHRIAVLRDWMLGGRLPDKFNPRHDLRAATSRGAAEQLGPRVAIYEMLQEQQRVRPGLSVLVPPEWPVASVLDVADLVRTRVSVVGPAPALRTAVAAASMLAAGASSSKPMRRSGGIGTSC